MRSHRSFSIRVPLAAVLATMLLAPAPGFARDVDGPNDCARFYHDFGDAPCGIQAYPSGVIGHFPTCVNYSCPMGTIDGPCPPNFYVHSGTTGWVDHLASFGVSNAYFWLGCGGGVPGGPSGVDGEPNGKVNTPPTGISACNDTVHTDCVEPAFGTMAFDQDECTGDPTDAGLVSPPLFRACTMATVSFDTHNCGATQTAYLQILVDMNEDGDWLDSFQCSIGGQTVCVHEWAVRDAPLTLAPGCELEISPSFPIGPLGGHGWMRISISAETVPGDFPYEGSLYRGGQHFPPVGQLIGGETEDYPVEIASATPARKTTWGEVKIHYR